MTDNYPAKELVDIHCHIIPGVDDGSDGFESTMKMLIPNSLFLLSKFPK